MNRRVGRWPDWVYRHGTEPDYRFSLANERTFLAWIRTALALFAAGAALDVVDLSVSQRLQDVLAVALVLLGITSAAIAWWRWGFAERAMRLSRPLPGFGFGLSFAIGIAVGGTAVVAATLLA